MKKFLFAAFMSVPVWATGDYQQDNSQATSEEDHSQLPLPSQTTQSLGNPLLPINQDYYSQIFRCWKETEYAVGEARGPRNFKEIKELAIVDPQSVQVLAQSGKKSGIITYTVYRIRSEAPGKVKLVSQTVKVTSDNYKGYLQGSLNHSPGKKEELEFDAQGNLSPQSKNWKLSFALMRALGRRDNTEVTETNLENLGQSQQAEVAFTAFIKDHIRSAARSSRSCSGL